MHRHHSVIHRPGIILLILAILVFTLSRLAHAQDDASQQVFPIEMTGVVTEMSSTTLVVAGLTVDVSSIDLDVHIVVGTTVTITGQLQNGIVIAQTVVLVAETNPEATPDPSSTLDDDAGVIIVVEGPVVNVVSNIITIYNFNIEVEPLHPILNLIDIGDVVRVEGAFNPRGIIVASVVSNLSAVHVVDNDSDVTVGLDGPVEAIDGNIVIVNGIPVQFDSANPLLQTLQMGDFVSVQGNFHGSGSTIVLVVVNVVIINNVIVDSNPYCWYHQPGMGMGMGHWHCDGMGMGGMGMGMGGMGMGMGG